MLVALMDHPILVSASHSFRAMPERKFSFSEESSLQQPRQSKCVYVFQREYATVDPSLVDVSSYLYFFMKLILNALILDAILNKGVPSTLKPFSLAFLEFCYLFSHSYFALFCTQPCMIIDLICIFRLLAILQYMLLVPSYCRLIYCQLNCETSDASVCYHPVLLVLH